MNIIKLADYFDSVALNEKDYIANALATGLSGNSRTVRDYEESLESYFHASHAIAVSSGFGALVVALHALGLKPGDRVLLTPTCPLCTAYALTFMRLEPVFCDICPNNFTIDLDHAKRRIDARTRAIIDIPMWGYPVEARGVSDFARAHGLHYILDVALSHRAELNGKLLWSYADIATFSTHSSKNLVTGEGGAVLTDSDALATKARLFTVPDESQIEEPVLNFALGGLQGALGLARLPRFESDTARRLENMRCIADRLDNPYLEVLPVIEGGVPAGTKLIIREINGNNDGLLLHQTKGGIPSDIANYNCKPLYQYPVFTSYAESCPNAEAMLSSITTIPVHPDIDSGAINQIIEVLNTYWPADILEADSYESH